MRALRPTAGTRDPAPLSHRLQALRPGPRVASLLAALAAWCVTEPARAAAEPKERTITTEEVVSWLDAKGDATPLTDSGAEEEELAPAPPPRHRGFVVESGIGAFGQIGEMKHISPIAPWFHLQFGYEPLRFL